MDNNASVSIPPTPSKLNREQRRRAEFLPKGYGKQTNLRRKGSR